MQERWAEIQTIWKSNPVLYVIVGFLAGILFFPAIGALFTDASQLLSGFVPEAVGIAFTVLLIDRLYQRREQEREERELKARLVREAGSPDNATALNAIRELRGKKWLARPNGVLKEANLIEAKLQNADLWGADLRECNLQNSQLQKAQLMIADLSDSDLNEANLENTNLISCNLAGANFLEANLSGANLTNANMTRAMLGFRAEDYLKHFQLGDVIAMDHETAQIAARAGAFKAKFDINTILPDGTRWTPVTDVTRFTDPNHPDFWEPDWVKQQREQNH